MKTSLLSFLLLLGCASVHAKFGTDPVVVSLVQSVPAETDLAVPGLSFAKDEWVKLIDASQSTIDVEQMYVDGKQGEATDDVIAALNRAGERGVKIRFILSKQMINTNKPTLDEIKKIPGIELRVLDLGAITGGIQHAKFWIFDQKTFFVGSQNFDWKALTQILETGVTVQDETMAAQLKTIFDLDFEMARTGHKPSDLGIAPMSHPESDIYLVANPPVLNPKNIKSGLDELTELLRGARKTVRITLLDISNYLFGRDGEWRVVDQLLRDTAARGVKIELLVSHWNTEKPEINTIKGLSAVKNIEVKIATIPDLATGHVPYSRVNHSKFMIIDDSILWVGTSNWTKGYFLDTRGIEIVMKRADLAASANQIFSRLWGAPYSLPVDINRDYPKPIK